MVTNSRHSPILMPAPPHLLPLLEAHPTLADPLPVSTVVSTGHCWEKILPQRFLSSSTFGPSWLKVSQCCGCFPALCTPYCPCLVPYCLYSTHVVIFSFWNLDSSTL